VTNQWKSRPSMPTRRFGPASMVLNGKLYVMGGKGPDHVILKSVDYYDPSHNKWFSGPEMPSRAYRFGAVATSSSEGVAMGGLAPLTIGKNLFFHP
jgi:N-acetylneuraminic acid mutarotase